MPAEYAPLSDGQAQSDDNQDVTSGGAGLERGKRSRHKREGSLALSVEERKRIWWRSALISALFIASWFAIASLDPL